MRHIFILILTLFSIDTFCQAWARDDSEKALYINNLHYASFNDIIKGCDSAYYLFTQHQPAEYWKTKNSNKGELLVSRIDTNGVITYLRKLDTHSEKTYKAVFNNKYYLLDLSPTEIKGQSYYKGFVYNSRWENENTFLIRELKNKNQRRFPKFVVDKNENIYLYSTPYYLDHRPQDFTGSYLIKCDKEGNVLKEFFFEKSEITKLEISETALSIKVVKEKFVYPFYVTDSIISLTADFELTPIKKTSEEYKVPQKENNVTASANLYSGEKVVLYDSSYAVGDNGTKFVKKIAFYNINNNREWSYQIPESYHYSAPRPLKNGNYIIEVTKWNKNLTPYDTICFTQFDKSGSQKIIKCFLDGARPGVDRYLISSYYFEPKKNEIWLFYQKSSDQQDERIYFMKLFLNG